LWRPMGNTSGFLAALECTKFLFGRDSAERAYSAPPDPLASLTGDPTSKGKGSGAEGRGDAPNANSWIRPWIITLAAVNNQLNNNGTRGHSVARVRVKIRNDTRCYFNVRSKADMGHLNLPHGNNN